MGEYLRIPWQPNPLAKLPDDLDQAVWRYMDFWKFKDILKTKTLYLSRADCLQDKFEGTYSRERIEDMNQFFRNCGYEDMVSTDRTQRDKARRQHFISCWCMSEYDVDLMWRAYVRERPGIAIKSSPQRLLNLIKSAEQFQPLNLSKVDYDDRDKGMIWVTGGFEAFIHKDPHFKLDNEIRIIHSPNIQEPIPDHVRVPVDLDVLIDLVVLAPGSSAHEAKRVRQLMDTVCLSHKAMEYSRDDRPVTY